jgi:hypothetical protein
MPNQPASRKFKQLQGVEPVPDYAQKRVQLHKSNDTAINTSGRFGDQAVSQDLSFHRQGGHPDVGLDRRRMRGTPRRY